ncbi:MAG: hypothetical protein IKV82_01470 [Akkermansia sp.]|nr:hypothetical protein [Akkermansia sp.]
MLRKWIPAALVCAFAAAPVGAGVNAPHPGAMEAALQEESPYAVLWAEGLPLPPSRIDVAAMPATEFVRQQSAIKQVLLARGVRAYAERKRVTDENLLACARLAEQLQAPREFSLYLRLLASDELGSRQRYLVQSALDALLQAYLVDELQMRYLVEYSALTGDEVDAVLAWLPLQPFFNMVPVGQGEAAMAADYHLLHGVYTRLTTAYASVQDKESADAVADTALRELILHESTAYTRLHAPAHLKARLSPHLGNRLLQPALSLQQERLRLREHNYFGSLRLRLFDLLLG